MSLRTLLAMAVMGLAAFLPSRAHTAETIGTTTVLVRSVTGTLDNVSRQLVLRDGVYQTERIETRPESASEIRFRDATKLTLGPNATVVLDSFVFDPNPSRAKFALSAGVGAFRFVSGQLDRSAYKIKTPVATIGVRGTVFSWVTERSGATTILLESDASAVTVTVGNLTRVLNRRGMTLRISPTGAISPLRLPSAELHERLAEIDRLLASGPAGAPRDADAGGGAGSGGSQGTPRGQ